MSSTAKTGLVAFLIKPNHIQKTCSIEQVELSNNEDTQYKDILRNIEANSLTVVRAERTKVLRGHVAYMDDEGLLVPHAGYITCKELYPLPLAGNLLITGISEFGNSVDASLTLAEISRLFKDSWTSPEMAREKHREAEDKHRRTSGGVYLSGKFE